MPASLAELKKLTAFCRKNGIFRIKTADFEFEIDRGSLAPLIVAERGQPIEQVGDQFPPWESMSEEQRLLWSSTPPGIPNEEPNAHN